MSPNPVPNRMIVLFFATNRLLAPESVDVFAAGRIKHNTALCKLTTFSVHNAFSITTVTVEKSRRL